MNSQIIREDCRRLLSNFDGLREMSGKSLLITGSNGLIGNYLVNLLSVANEAYGAKIKAYCVSKHAPQWRDAAFEYVSQDLSLPFSFPFRVDYIFHGACYGRPKKFLEDELETIALNVTATKALLEMARANNARFLFPSTSEIYGNPPPSEIPTKETYAGNSLTSSSRAAYVESKRLGETLCYIFHRNFGVDAKVARIALVYGPGISLQDERVMGNFMKKAIVDRHIRMMDEGKSLRTYCYATDALNMLLRMMLQGKDTLYNVGGVETVSILDMARMTAEICGATFEGVPGKGLKDAPDIVKLDVGKVCGEFGITRFTPFRDGLKRTIDWNLSKVKQS